MGENYVKLICLACTGTVALGAATYNYFSSRKKKNMEMPGYHVKDPEFRQQVESCDKEISKIVNQTNNIQREINSTERKLVNATEQEQAQLIERLESKQKELEDKKQELETVIEKNNDVIERYNQEIEQFQAEYDKLLEKQKNKKQVFENIKKQLEEQNITTIDDFKKRNKENFKLMIDLCKEIQPMKKLGRQVGLFGFTGVGKSTLLNALLGKKVAQVGHNQTTMQAIEHEDEHRGIIFWDIPGYTDEISYFTFFFIQLLKSLDFIGLVITRTISEITNLIELLESLELEYYILVNKVDVVKEEIDGYDECKNTIENEVDAAKEETDEYDDFKNQIHNEVDLRCNHNFFKDIFFVSGKYPKKSDDWERLNMKVEGTSIQLETK